MNIRKVLSLFTIRSGSDKKPRTKCKKKILKPKKKKAYIRTNTLRIFPRKQNMSSPNNKEVTVEYPTVHKVPSKMQILPKPADIPEDVIDLTGTSEEETDDETQMMSEYTAADVLSQIAYDCQEIVDVCEDCECLKVRVLDVCQCSERYSGAK
jgi:hypothetical protein